MKNPIYANTSFKNRNPRHYQVKSCWWQFFWCVHHVSLNLAGCKVSHDFLQHHHHEWRHHHRHQHNQHAVHQLFQSNLFPRVCTTSAPPQPLAQLALPSSPDWDGLLPEDSRWPQLHAITIGWWQLSTQFHSISSFFPPSQRSSLFPKAPRSSLLPSECYWSPWARGQYHLSRSQDNGDICFLVSSVFPITLLLFQAASCIVRQHPILWLQQPGNVVYNLLTLCDMMTSPGWSCAVL